MIFNSDANVILTLLNAMDGPRWLILGVVLLVLEVVTGTTYVLWVAAAALIVGLLTLLLPLGWPLQLSLFFVLSIVLLVVGHKYFRPRVIGAEDSDLNDRAKSMVGMRVKAIADFDTGRGRVQVGDTQWRAEMETGNASEGQELRIASVRGTTLIVEPF